MISEKGDGSKISQVNWALRSPRGGILRSLFSSTLPMSFKEVSSKIGIAPSLCAYHLKLLSDRGLVVRTFEHSEGRKDFSFYRITALGVDIVKFNDSIESDTRPAPRSIRILAWRNMPRCFIHRGK